jgi:hypothetical protein
MTEVEIAAACDWLTAEEIAAACDWLAAECEAGRRRRLGAGQAFTATGRPCCALGVALHRAGMRPRGPILQGAYTATRVCGVQRFGAAGLAAGAVERANDDADAADRPRAVVEPLRELAAALRAEARR